MLLLLSEKTPGSSVILPSSFENDLAAETGAAFCDPRKGEIALRRIERVEPRGRENLLVTLSGGDVHRVPSAILNALFAAAKSFLFTEDMAERLFALGGTFERPPVVIDLAESAGALSVTYVDAPDSTFIAHRMTASDTELFYRNLDGLKADIDREIAGHRPDLQKYTDRFLALMREFAAPLSGRLADTAPRRIDVRLDGVSRVPPFELIEGSPLVRYLIPGKPAATGWPDEPAALVVHSPELLYSSDELTRLMPLLRGRFRLEVRPDASLTGDAQPDVYEAVHFSGHGEIRDGEGKILCGGVWTDRLPGIRPARHTTLNCCHAGHVPGGIVAKILRGGSQSLVASPYRLPDKPERGITDFYRFYRPGEAFAAYAVAAAIDPAIRFRYRFFSICE